MYRSVFVFIVAVFAVLAAGCGQQQPPAENPPADSTQVVEAPDTTVVVEEAASAMMKLPEPWPQDFEVLSLFVLLTNETLEDGSQQAELFIPDSVRGTANLFTVYDSLRVGNENWLVPEGQELDCWSSTAELNVPLTNGTQYILATGNWATEDNTIHLHLNLRNL